MKQGIFVTGTGTGVGKTLVSSLLLSAHRAYGKKAGYFKPIQTGTESDTAWVLESTEVTSSDICPPVYSFPEPIAPSRAAQKNGVFMEIDTVVQKWDSLDSRTWIIEGAGGLLVPMNSNQTMRSLIVALDLPIVVVASTALGTINHTLLTLEAAKNAWISVLGIVLVGEEDPGLESVLGEFSDVPVLCRIPLLTDLSSRGIRHAAREFFPETLIHSIAQAGGS